MILNLLAVLITLAVVGFVLYCIITMREVREPLFMVIGVISVALVVSWAFLKTLMLLGWIS